MLSAKSYLLKCKLIMFYVFKHLNVHDLEKIYSNIFPTKLHFSKRRSCLVGTPFDPKTSSSSGAHGWCLVPLQNFLGPRKKWRRLTSMSEIFHHKRPTLYTPGPSRCSKKNSRAFRCFHVQPMKNGSTGPTQHVGQTLHWGGQRYAKIINFGDLLIIFPPNCSLPFVTF